jgi:hypothetical protein
VTTDTSHEEHVFGLRPKVKVRAGVAAGVLSERVMTPLEKLDGVRILSICHRLHSLLMQRAQYSVCLVVGP